MVHHPEENCRDGCRGHSLSAVTIDADMPVLQEADSGNDIKRAFACAEAGASCKWLKSCPSLQRITTVHCGPNATVYPGAAHLTTHDMMLCEMGIRPDTCSCGLILPYTSVQH